MPENTYEFPLFVALTRSYILQWTLGNLLKHSRFGNGGFVGNRCDEGETVVVENLIQ